MAPTQIVLLLSLGSFQAFIPGVTKEPSAVFEDSAQGLKAFTAWSQSAVPVPKFNQPPLSICVVASVPFTKEHAPYVPKPLWESQPPVHALEPYAATFHYVELAPGSKPPKTRTLKQAIELCAESKPK